MGDSCCGAVLQEIVLSSPGPAGPGVVLHRCSRCGQRQYTRGTQVVDPTDAFQSLAGTFQAERARAARPVRAEMERRAVGAAARAARSAQAAGTTASTTPSTAAAERAALRAAARDEKERTAAAQATAQSEAATLDVTDLADLLSGWTVLGATG
ncbi:MAG: hypothetical protein Q8R60_09780 [Mycobacteriales bacterium]|nr:hypothetical protein [Mycobacteriales bacterium]